LETISLFFAFFFHFAVDLSSLVFSIAFLGRRTLTTQKKKMSRPNKQRKTLFWTYVDESQITFKDDIAASYAALEKATKMSTHWRRHGANAQIQEQETNKSLAPRTKTVKRTGSLVGYADRLSPCGAPGKGFASNRLPPCGAPGKGFARNRSLNRYATQPTTHGVHAPDTMETKHLVDTSHYVVQVHSTVNGVDPVTHCLASRFATQRDAIQHAIQYMTRQLFSPGPWQQKQLNQSETLASLKWQAEHPEFWPEDTDALLRELNQVVSANTLTDLHCVVARKDQTA
jgi:hypothetical protein